MHQERQSQTYRQYVYAKAHANKCINKVCSTYWCQNLGTKFPTSLLPNGLTQLVFWALGCDEIPVMVGLNNKLFL